MRKEFASLSHIALLVGVIWLATVNVVAAFPCPRIDQQKDLNPLVIKNMPDPPNPDTPAVCGGIMTYHMIARPISLNPITRIDASTSELTARIYDSLLDGKIDKPVSRMAETYESSDNQQTVTLTLRKGIKFANGDPVTAEDVRFTFENLIYPKEIASSDRDVISCGDGTLPVIRVEAPDKISFTCALKTRTFLAFIGSIEILNKKKVLELVPNVEKSPKDFNTALSLATSPEKMRGIGAGPFVLTKLDPGSVAEFARNPFYWESDKDHNQLPYLNGIRILIAPTDGQVLALASFRNGQTDWFVPRPDDISLLQADKASRGFPVNDDINSGFPLPGTTFWVLSWTAKNPALQAAFRAKEFRQAMSYLTDRAAINKNIFNGLGTEIYWSLNPLSEYYVERPGQPQAVIDRVNKAKFSFDLVKAREILDSLGLKDTDGDGIREIPQNFQGRGNPAGKLEFALSTNAGNTLRIEIAQQIANDARRAGVLINVDTKDAAVLFDKLQTGDYEAILTSLSGGYVPESSANVFTCDGNLHFFNVICPFEKRNNPQVDYEKFEKKVDDFYGNGAVAQEIKEAKKIWDDAQILIGEFQP
ncbi:hypothetical protein HY230_09535, partial [Candidatus Acetothermia bacterium]|nr:hypothetical protein [Candidatus Acetothermia bacterium]